MFKTSNLVEIFCLADEFCNEFVNYHKGSISVESEPGKGCVFKVTLPKKQG